MTTANFKFSVFSFQCALPLVLLLLLVTAFQPSSTDGRRVMYLGDVVVVGWPQVKAGAYRVESSDDLASWTLEYEDWKHAPGQTVVWQNWTFGAERKIYRLVPVGN